ncbi:caspase-1-like [Polyodon spathula]|uniref:caspase-1-like n=1 Tax=Polyodon spathula TaxID=7913 RepID=UPI001B7EBD0D|nr:caspase-1-like [Polyodon spathula]
MADQTLRGLRPGLVENLNRAVVSDLLDDLQERKIFNTGEVEEVQEGQRTTKEKARSLLDMVVRKGPRACEGFIECLRQRDQELCSRLQL